MDMSCKWPRYPLNNSVCTRRVMTGQSRTFPHSLRTIPLSRCYLQDTKSQRRRDGALSVLNAAIEAMNLAKEVSGATPAKAVLVPSASSSP